MVREPHYGGCERDMARLALHMDRTRFTPHVGCFRPEGLQRPALEAAGVPIVQFDVPSFKSWNAVRAVGALGEYVKKHKIAVVHPFDVPTDIWAVPAARWVGVPLIVSSQLSYRSLDFYPPSHLRVLRMGDRWADHWMVNSRAVQEHMTRDEGLPAERISVHYNGVDTTLFYPGERGADGPVTIGTVSVFRPEKKMEWLMAAFAKMREPARLVLVGDGPERERLQRLAGELGLGPERCRFEPATNEAWKWFRSFDIFCLTSSNESFPNSLLEAMACGCAVAGSDVGGVPELIDDGVNGLLFRPGDVETLAGHLDQLARDRAGRERMSAAAAAKAAEYTVAKYCRGIEIVYTTNLTRKGFLLSDDRIGKIPV